MQTAWRERNPQARIKAAKEAIGLNPECATAYILLAEEEVNSINTLVTKKSVQYVAQFLDLADLYCACERFCYSVSPWVTCQKF